MKVNYSYQNPSTCLNKGDKTFLELSPDTSRDEKVSFLGKLKNPLKFRDSMLMLREIVISDMRQEKKEREEFFQWLEGEIEKKILEHEEYMPNVRDEINKKINNTLDELKSKDREIEDLNAVKKQLSKELNKHDPWREYYKIERSFWEFLYERDKSLWFVLDPVITVHPDQVSFEAFSLDESTYGCLSIDMNEFELLQEPSLGTTNIDFSHKLAIEIERFRTFNDVQLSVNPDGFTVDSNVMPEYVEKKIDLPETWIKGFNQVSSASSLEGIDVELTPADMYDICSFLRRHKEKKGPRYMKWILEPKKPIKILFEPFGKILTLKSIYSGSKKREEKIWGRRRWLVLEKIIPLVKSFKVRLLGFSMPTFIVGDMGGMKLTIGLSSWSSNDWVKGTSFNILSGFIGDGNYNKVYDLLKEKRFASLDDIYKSLNEDKKSITKAGVGMLLRKGEGYYDPVKDIVRFRRLCSEDIPEELYKTTSTEIDVQKNLEEGMDKFKLMVNENGEFIFTHSLKTPNPKRWKWKYYNTDDYKREFDMTETLIQIDGDGQITKLGCTCKEFKKGPRNISAPCSHILALYVMSIKFLKLELEPNKEYRINDIMEKVLW